MSTILRAGLVIVWMIQYVGVHLADSQLVLHRSLLPNNGVVYVNIREMVPDFSSAQISQSVLNASNIYRYSLSSLCHGTTHHCHRHHHHHNLDRIDFTWYVHF